MTHRSRSKLRDGALGLAESSAVLSVSLSASLVQAADSVGDDRSSAIVYTIVVVLAVIGAVLIGLAVWVWRATSPDRQLLAPLELMDDQDWLRQDPQNRRRALDEVRPDGASPLVPSVRRPNLDDEFDEVPPVADFDDLTEPIDDPLVISVDDHEDDGWDDEPHTDDDPVTDDDPSEEEAAADDDLDWEASATDVLDKAESADVVGERDDTQVSIGRPTVSGDAAERP